ncbi:MAG: cell wall hydrolase [Roseiarcus sp.]|jgi:spore germination cell wall hydrolase CwlJ-like protein
MGRSRLAWVGSTVAPWGIALGFLVSITAQAGEEVGLDPQSLRISAFVPASASARPIIEASLTLGSRVDLAATSDEIDPNPAVKQGRSAFPAIDRSGKGDPFIIFRPSFQAKRAPQPAPHEAESAEDWPDDSRSPARVADIDPSAPSALLPFGDGATPEAPLDFALNSSTPTSSDGKVLIAEQKPAPQKAAATAQTTAATPQTPAAAAQATVASQLASGAKPDYASLIDPKDSARQMRCLGEAIYFEARSEPEAGQAAVAQVVLNRVRSGIFPTDVCAVVYQDRNHPFACQFSFACEGKSLRIEEPAAWATATRIAQAVVSGANYNPKLVEALNYHANYVYPFWAPSLRRVDRIGAHIFYAMRAGMNWAPGALNGRGDLPPLQPQASASPLIQTVAAAKGSVPTR